MHHVAQHARWRRSRTHDTCHHARRRRLEVGGEGKGEGQVKYEIERECVSEGVTVSLSATSNKHSIQRRQLT